MQISEVLELHFSFEAEHSFIDILGDAILLKTNKVYKNIRSESLNIGCRYVEAWPEYLLMPFHALGEIVADKKIPYVPGARLLKMVEDKRVDTLCTDDLNIPQSYHLHEAAHVIAEHLFRDTPFSDSQEKILKTIVCESFANTVDALANVFVVDETQRFFLQHNCYMHPSDKDRSLMHRLVKDLSLRDVFVYVFIAYVHANFLSEMKPADFNKLDNKRVKDFKALMKMAEKLDPLFRMQTTQMYLKLEGHDGEIEELLSFDFMKTFDSNPVFRETMEAMAAIVSK